MAGTELNLNLHPAQLEVFNDPHRFRIVVAGRRFGKSFLSAVVLLIEAAKTKNDFGYDITDKDVFYVAPTFPQAKDIMWFLLKRLGKDFIVDSWENTGVLEVANGRRIHLKGSDRPDSLRGVGLSYAVLDEFASMKPHVWEEILRPTLADVKGGALFIGTPAGKNHFYELYQKAQGVPDWATFAFKSTDNPFLDSGEIENARSGMSHESFRQEFEASFSSGGGKLFQEDQIVLGEPNPEESIYIAVDPAGFADVSGNISSALKRLDEMAIAVVGVSASGWHVHDIITGRWGIRQASLEILRAAQKYKPLAVGIEKGALKNAIMPYLQDQMRRIGVFPNIVECTHGSQKKIDRIVWALQGRLQNGRITFSDGHYLKKFKDQAMDFPNPMAHDDMLDALAYIDQISVVTYQDDIVIDSWEPTDSFAGF